MALRKLGYEYLLGDDDAEIERLRFQHTVWGPVTSRFFDRLNVQRGWRCLDVGAGPGLVSMDLRARVGNEGAVTAMEPSESFRGWLTREIERHNWKNLHIIPGHSYETSLPSGEFDLVFVRWVIGFVPDPEQFLRPLVAALKPNGIVAVQDYVHEGCALFPKGGAWDRFPEQMRQWWRSGGGDPYVAAKLPAIMRRLGLVIVDYTPTCLTGGPESRVTEWMARYLKSQVPVMVERGIMNREEADALMADWQVHMANPETIFFSPLVLDVAGSRHE